MWRLKTFPDESPPDRSRITWVDHAKGIGILLVVFGHALRGLLAAEILPDTPTWRFVDAWIYAFHMPLFFFLSGLFILSSTRRPYPHFVHNKLRTIAYPYVVWSLIQGILLALAANAANSDVLGLTELWRISYLPQMQFWFLYVLFVCMLLGGLVARWPGGAWLMVAFAVALLATHGTVPLGPWGVLYLVRIYLPYFAIGIAFAHLGGVQRWAVVPSWALLLVTAAGFAIVTAAVRMGLDGIDLAGAPVALAGILATIALAALCSRVPRWLKMAWLEVCGRSSLEIYVAHTIVSAGFRIILIRVFDITEPWTHLVGGTLVGVLGPLVLVWITQRIGFPYLFSWPGETSAATTDPSRSPRAGSRAAHISKPA